MPHTDVRKVFWLGLIQFGSEVQGYGFGVHKFSYCCLILASGRYHLSSYLLYRSSVNQPLNLGTLNPGTDTSC
jgi:hypothetical protein